MIFTEKHILDIESYTSSGELSLLGILRIFENIGNHHSEVSGDSTMQKLQNGISWILLSWTVRIEKFPRWISHIQVSTWTYGKLPSVSVNRDYLICDEQGNKCILGSAKFALLDILKKKPIRINADLIEKYHPEDLQNFAPPELKPIIEPQQYQIVKTITLRRSDIDFNQHIHNLSYLTFVQELLPEKIYSEKTVSMLKINFKKASTAKEILTGKLSLSKNENNVIDCIAGIYGEYNTLRCLVQMQMKDVQNK